MEDGVGRFLKDSELDLKELRRTLEGFSLEHLE